MEFAKRRRRRRRSGGGAGKLVIGLVLAGAAVYVITASAAGRWLSEKVMAPAISAMSGLSIFSSDSMDALEQQHAPQPETEVLSVSLSSGRSTVTADVSLPAIELHALQVGAFSSESNALGMAGEERLGGAGGYVMADGDIYRVLSAGYPSIELARSEKDKLVEAGRDCTLYTICAPAVTFNITGSKEQLEDISLGFEALTAAQRELQQACMRLDDGSLTVSEGVAEISGISLRLREALSALDEYGSSSPAIAQILRLRDSCVASLDKLSAESTSVSALSSGMRYALMEFSDAYSKMLNGMG